VEVVELKEQLKEACFICCLPLLDGPPPPGGVGGEGPRNEAARAPGGAAPLVAEVEEPPAEDIPLCWMLLRIWRTLIKK
jgi:hypothetical protein